MRKLDQFDMRATGLFNKVRNGDPDDEIEDEIGDALRAAYEAGLRRAQELVKELAPEGPRTCSRAEHGWVRVGFDAFDAAIDAEVAKEGK